MDKEIVIAIIGAVTAIFAALIAKIKHKAPPSSNNYLKANTKNKTRIEDLARKEISSKFFLFKKEYDRETISKDVIDKEKNIVESSYGPFNAFDKTFSLKFESYLIPLIKKRIEIEESVHLKFKIPLNNGWIKKLNEDIEGIIDENWEYIVWHAYENATRHVIHHQRDLPRYKEKELIKMRNEYLAKRPKEYLIELENFIKSIASEIEYKINEH